jgi:exosome complex exonuclease DIS3/RRP44
MHARQGALRVNRFNPWEGYVGSESAGQDILLAGRAAMNRAIDGDIVAVELLPEEQWVRACSFEPPCQLVAALLPAS